MREIKLRAKTATTDEWVYGHYAFVDGYHIIYENGRPLIIKLNTLGQYTGLKDKNSREIFEGDILKFEHLKDYACEYQKVLLDKWLWGTEEFAFCEMVERKYVFEVVGNIYENRELINSTI